MSLHDTPLCSGMHDTPPLLPARCGMRGGYMEVVGLDPEVLVLLEKYFAVMLCPNVSGQVCVEVTHTHTIGRKSV